MKGPGGDRSCEVNTAIDIRSIALGSTQEGHIGKHRQLLANLFQRQLKSDFPLDKH
jgi:hypothetical protein